MSHDLITQPELEARLGYTPANTDQIDALITDASALVRLVAGTDFHDDDGNEITTPPALLSILTNMIRRGLENPRGLATESIDDYSYSTHQGQSFQIYPTRNEKRLIRRAVSDIEGANRLGVSSAVLDGNLPVTPNNLVYELLE